MNSSLTIPVIEDYVYLGCSIEERKFQHRVHYSVELSFSGIPYACTTDTLDKTPCYAEIAQALSSISGDKHYATIEHLAMTGMMEVQKYVRGFKDIQTKEIVFSVHKLNPPVSAIKAGSTFTLRETFA